MNAVMTATLASTAHKTTWSDVNTVMDWLPDFLQTFLTQVAQSGTVPDEAKIIAQQIAELQQQLGGSLTAVAQELAGFVVNANGATILQKTQNAQSAFLQKFPKFTAVAEGMFFMAWCGGIYMVVKAFQDWKNLKPEDKARAILCTVQLGLSALDVVPAFIKGVMNMGVDGWNKFQEWRASRASAEWMDRLVRADPDLEPLEYPRQIELFTSGGVKTTGTLWESIFEAADKIVGVIGVVASAAFAVLSAIDFANDIREGQPISKQALDGVMMAANFAMTVCLVLDLVVASTVFAMAAAVFAIIGIIVAIVEMFVVKPKNPLDEFMSNTVVPFVNGLPAQTPPPGGSTPTISVALIPALA